MGIETEFQQSLYDVLNDAKASLGITEVYDIAPQAEDGGSAVPFPYVVMGDIFAVQWDTQTTVGFQVTFRLHTYSRTGSKAECKDIQGKMFNLLHRKPMTIVGFNHILQLREDTECNDGIDKKIHGICEYFGMVETVE